MKVTSNSRTPKYELKGETLRTVSLMFHSKPLPGKTSTYKKGCFQKDRSMLPLTIDELTEDGIFCYDENIV